LDSTFKEKLGCTSLQGSVQIGKGIERQRTILTILEVLYRWLSSATPSDERLYSL
jgi:hypothetical protein